MNYTQYFMWKLSILNVSYDDVIITVWKPFFSDRKKCQQTNWRRKKKEAHRDYLSSFRENLDGKDIHIWWFDDPHVKIIIWDSIFFNIEDIHTHTQTNTFTMSKFFFWRKTTEKSYFFLINFHSFNRRCWWWW